MAHATPPSATNPAVLRFRGRDLEAMTALQLRSIRALRQTVNLTFDTIEAITRCQSEFLEAGIDRMNAAFEDGANAPDPRTVFERQNKAYRALLEALAAQTGELAELTSKCCAGLVREAARNSGDASTDDGREAGPAGAADAAA